MAAALHDAHAALSGGTAAALPCAPSTAYSYRSTAALAATAATADATAAVPPAWLVIGIPTVPRRGGVDYLSATLASLLAELPSADASTGGDPFGPGAVKIVVMNMAARGTPHAAFAAASARFSLGKGAAYITFEAVPPDGACDDVSPDAPPVDDLHNPHNLPGPEVRRQTCHLAALLDAAAPRGAFYMFMEDDFDTCGHALRAVHYAVAKASLRVPDWLALRVSYGMNGIVMRTADVPTLAGYLRRHVARLPPDLLWREWAQAGGSGRRRSSGGGAAVAPRRPLLVYRQNLLSHTGTVSSFAVRPARKAWPGCYAPMAKVWSLSRREQFDAARCAHEDISPCAALRDAPEDWATRLPLFGVADDGTPP